MYVTNFCPHLILLQNLFLLNSINIFICILTKASHTKIINLLGLSKVTIRNVFSGLSTLAGFSQHDERGDYRSSGGYQPAPNSYPMHMGYNSKNKHRPVKHKPLAIRYYSDGSSHKPSPGYNSPKKRPINLNFRPIKIPRFKKPYQRPVKTYRPPKVHKPPPKQYHSPPTTYEQPQASYVPHGDDQDSKKGFGPPKSHDTTEIVHQPIKEVHPPIETKTDEFGGGGIHVVPGDGGGGIYVDGLQGYDISLEGPVYSSSAGHDQSELLDQSFDRDDAHHLGYGVFDTKTHFKTFYQRRLVKYFNDLDFMFYRSIFIDIIYQIISYQYCIN